ncbi:MAG: copper chaperone PCu(A)C [Granulosicoccus sp.]
MKTLSKALASTFALFAFAVSPSFASSPEISNARIIQPPPAAKVAAAYFDIENTSDEPLVITGADSDDVPMVSIHLSVVIDDVAKMLEQESVTIDAGDTLEFKHGSYHLMLMGLTEPLVSGSNIAFELQTTAGTLPIQIPVISPDEAANMSAGTMDHGKMKHDNMNHDATKKMKHGDHAEMENK